MVSFLLYLYLNTKQYFLYFHNSIFAKWWTTQIAEHPEERHEIKIRCAINARRIMSHDLSWLTADTPGKLLQDLI